MIGKDTIEPNCSPLKSLDPIAKEILFRRYWSSTGWTQGDISPAEFAYAKDAGLMFDPVESKHDAVLTRAVHLRRRFTPEEIGNSFLASLSTRRLDWRSALGSYSSILHLAQHKYSPNEGSRACGVCGLYPRSTMQDVSIFNFERLKWGGVRHIQPDYAVLDLEWLSMCPAPQPVESDFQILRRMVDNIRQLAPASRPGDIEHAIQKVIPSNAWERRTLINILGLAGILAPRDFPSFRVTYSLWAERARPDGKKNDWGYPVWAWRGEDGINKESLNYWFPYL